MKWIGILAVIGAPLLAVPDIVGQFPQPDRRVGQQYEITITYETSQDNSGGSSSSSQGAYAIVERVIAVSENDVELEYDLPRAATTQDRAREWQLPARCLRRQDGSSTLINRDELEARLVRWLEVANWTRAVCGRWIFTWNAFRIECDPDSVIARIKAFDLRSIDLRAGASYQETGARGPATLSEMADGPNGARFVASMDVDPDAIRRDRAEADVALGELMGEPVGLEAALLKRARETITGTIEVTFDADVTGNARRETRVMRVEVDGPEGQETHVRTETIERKLSTQPATDR